MNIVAFSLVAIFSLGGVLTLDYLLVDYFWGESPSNGIIMPVSLAAVYMVWAGVITYFSQLTQSNFVVSEYESELIDNVFGWAVGIIMIPYVIVVYIFMFVAELIGGIFKHSK